MAEPRRFELDDLLIRPGTYYNPSTEILVTVDDSSHVDAELFEEAGDDEAEWVLVSDDVAIDEPHRDELLERFQARRQGAPEAVEEDYDEVDEDLEPDPDHDD